MREVAVDRFVGARPHEVADALDPASVVEYEESFNVLDVEADGSETVVTAGSRGLTLSLRFEPTESGIRYEQLEDAGPLAEMWTGIGWEAENEGTRVTARSGVSLGLPLKSVTDRIAAWKRRGELKRALRNLDAELS
jgi:hypothetical protein